ncbi:2-phospho-L-lactate guanylyltransferase [Isoptericola croceus]|uniref:2-phospho-L-lactate guanylyltransferase n=1 Tax=Isoptericola croceus TaxID=3031406 RepID=UPI0023F7C2ED|nr:2-phospho-L-lactate guanylyltransferase [Isoptericola croceus]
MTTPRTAGTVAVVPLRDGVSGKSRLAASVDAGARRRLVVALARHVVSVLGPLTASGRLAGVVVVTADVPFVSGVLAPVGRSWRDRQSELPTLPRTTDRQADTVSVIAQAADRPGLNPALDDARRHVEALGADRMLVVHADLPRLTVDDVEAVLAAPTDVVVATDRHDAGTNLLSVPLTGHDGGGFSFRFGPGSRAAHEAEASVRGLTSAVVRRPGTAADLDTIDDWAELPAEIRRRVGAVVGHPLTL